MIKCGFIVIYFNEIKTRFNYSTFYQDDRTYPLLKKCIIEICEQRRFQVVFAKWKYTGFRKLDWEFMPLDVSISGTQKNESDGIELKSFLALTKLFSVFSCNWVLCVDYSQALWSIFRKFLI